MKYLQILLILFIAFILNCDEAEGPFDPTYFTSFSGITFTDEAGNLIKIDPDDWLFSSDIGSYSFYPAYPNPISQSGLISLRYSIPTSSYIKIEIIDIQNFSVKLLVEQNSEAGLYMVIWDLTDFSNAKVAPGVYRCLFSLGEVTGHGDIWIKSK